jgi:sugar phosphate isomerase/epimerase
LLGAQNYVFHGPANVKRARNLVLNYDFIAERTQPLADLAKQYGIKLSWENVHWCWYASPEFAQKLLPLLSPGSLWLTFDLKQAVQSGFSAAEYLKAMQGHLSNVHICDVKVDDKLGCVPVLPFHGSVNFDSLKSQLLEIGYSGAVILEVYSHNYHTHQQLLENYTRTNHFFCD